MIRVGIAGAAGYTGGELLRLLLHHPQATVVFAHSTSHAGQKVADVHEGMIGETEMCFSQELPLTTIDVLFLCLAHGQSAAFLAAHAVPQGVKIIDLAQDFRLRGDHPFVYGLPERNRAALRGAACVANPGCFATAIQLALLPAIASGIITGDIHINGITGSTGAGQQPRTTTHHAWRSDNISVYKAFTHQHLQEIRQTLADINPHYQGRLLFIPQRGCFARGIFVSAYATCATPLAEARDIYDAYYRAEPFTHHVHSMPAMKQAVNTNKAIVYIDRHDDQLLMIACLDNLLKGAAGQAVQNMNIIFGIDETAGLLLKASAF